MQMSHIVDGNRLTVLTRGDERRDALVAMIAGAHTSLKLIYYIFAEDDAGTQLRAALMSASARGVRVQLIVDGFGSDATGDEAFLQPLKDAGATVCAFIPRWGRRFLLRNHQKMAIADDERALIGGFNIADAYFADSGATAWRDLGLIVDGPAAGQLARYHDALADWTRRPKGRIRDLKRTLQRSSTPAGRVRWLHGGPAGRCAPWLRAMRGDLAGARDLSLVAAYFAPTPSLSRLIDRIGRRGRARVVTAGKTDNPATIGAARFTFPGLLRQRVRVFEYQRCRLHTKLYVIDDIVHIGSANFDPRSLFLNVEIMLRVEDAAFAKTMRDYVDAEVADSCERMLAEFQGVASIPERMRNALCWFLVAVLDPGVTQRLRLGID